MCSSDLIYRCDSQRDGGGVVPECPVRHGSFSGVCKRDQQQIDVYGFRHAVHDNQSVDASADFFPEQTSYRDIHVCKYFPVMICGTVLR